MHIAGGLVFQAEATANAKVLRQEDDKLVRGKARTLSAEEAEESGGR